MRNPGCKGVIYLRQCALRHNSPSNLIHIASANQMSELETLIKKATDETLTSDNWQYILDVCDSISKSPEVNTKAAVKIVSARIAMKDANIILRTLSLLVAIAENCGSRMKQEIASTSFLQDSLIKRLGDRKLHKQVKFRVAEVIEQLNRSFKGDPSLKPIADAYNTVKSKYGQYLHSPPDKPTKQQITEQDKKQEEKELERALSLSVQEFEREQNLKKSYLNSKPLPQTGLSANGRQQAQTGSVQLAQTSNTSHVQDIQNLESTDTATIASVRKVCALYDLISYEPDELSFKKGEIITVIESVYRDWWRGMLPTGKVGIFPLNYVTPVVSKTPAELSRELSLESQLMDIELKKVDKLLAILSSNPDFVNEDEVTQLYNDVIPLKSSLAKFIDKHSTRKDELRTLHDQVISETKMYNEFIDTIVSLRTQSQYSGPLPYPTTFGELPAQPSTITPVGRVLEQQPTSAGFGNATYGQPTGTFRPPAPDSTPSFPQTFPQTPNYVSPPLTSFPQKQSSGALEHYLHYSRFPDVNNI